MLLIFSVRWSEDVVTCLAVSTFDFVFVIVQIQRFLASKFHVRFNKICTNSELLIRHNSQRVAFLLAL